MHISPVSQTTVKVIDKIVNSKNIPNTILFYNDYKNLGMSLVLNFIKKLTPKQKNIYNNPDISFVIPMTTTEKDYKENIKMFIEAIKQNIHISEEEWRSLLKANNKKFIIGVKQIKKVFENISKKSFYGGYRFVIVWRPEKMELNTSNKLLKTLEEPPEKTIFLFISKEHTRLLPTILSRTFKIKIDKLEEKEYVDFLSKEIKINTEEAKDLFCLFDGDYNKIKHHAEQKQNISEYVSLFRRWMRICYKKNIEEINLFVEDVAKTEKTHQRGFVSYCFQVIEKCFFVNNNIKKGGYINKEEEEFVKKLSPFIQNKYIGFLETLEEIIFCLNANINTKMIFYISTIKIIKLIKQ